MNASTASLGLSCGFHAIRHPRPTLTEPHRASNLREIRPILLRSSSLSLTTLPLPPFSSSLRPFLLTQFPEQRRSSLFTMRSKTVERASACRASEFFAFYRFIIKGRPLTPAPEFGGSRRDTGHAVESRRPFRMYEPVFTLPPLPRPPFRPRAVKLALATVRGARSPRPLLSLFSSRARPSLPRIDGGPRFRHFPARIRPDFRPEFFSENRNR